jgi:hypothetical protein
MRMMSRVARVTIGVAIVAIGLGGVLTVGVQQASAQTISLDYPSFAGTCTFTGDNDAVAFTSVPEVQFDGYGSCTGSVGGAPSITQPAQMDLSYGIVPLSTQQFGPFLAAGVGSANIYFNDLCPPDGPSCSSLNFEVLQLGGTGLSVAAGLGYTKDPSASEYGADTITFSTLGKMTGAL